MESFKKLGISKENLYPLIKKGFKEPTTIQTLTIPILLNEDVDLIAQAQTGTGKTAAFGLPLIEKINTNNSIQALILTPTRELAIQVCEELNSLSKHNKYNYAIPVYGGQSIDLQFKKLKKNPSIVVGTPGRILDHLKRKTLTLEKIQFFILDEADEMLNMGFIEDIETIFNYTPEEKRVFLFSATMPKKIRNLAENYMKNYKFVKANNEIATNLTEQIYYELNNKDKFEALCRIIDMNKEFYGLIFCQTKIEVDRVSARLIERGYKAECLHGDLSQAQRERTLNKFRKRAINILVATDVAARGIDIIDLTHVINYSVPQNPEIYIHRIGRTGRAGKNGKSITFVAYDEIGKFEIIKRVSKCKIKKDSLPDLKEIFETKKDKIINEIKSYIDNTDQFFDLWAEELLNLNDPKKVISAILNNFYKEEFDKKSYCKISNKNIHNEKKVRLFFARGKNDGLTKKKLVEFIKSHAEIPESSIERIEILENFSFFTVSSIEAEIILYSFKKLKNGKRPIIEKAKPFLKKN